MYGVLNLTVYTKEIYADIACLNAFMMYVYYMFCYTHFKTSTIKKYLA